MRAVLSPHQDTARAGRSRPWQDRSCPRCRGWRADRRDASRPRARRRASSGTARAAAAGLDDAAGPADAPTIQIDCSAVLPGSTAARRSTRLPSMTSSLRAAVGEEVLDLRRHRGGVDRHRDGADPAAAEEDLEQLDPVAAHHATRSPRVDAGPRAARPRSARRGLGGVAVRQRRRRSRGTGDRRSARPARAAAPAGGARLNAASSHRCRRRDRSPARAGRRRARPTAPLSAISPVSST